MVTALAPRSFPIGGNCNNYVDCDVTPMSCRHTAGGRRRVWRWVAARRLPRRNRRRSVRRRTCRRSRRTSRSATAAAGETAAAICRTASSCRTRTRRAGRRWVPPRRSAMTWTWWRHRRPRPARTRHRYARSDARAPDVTETGWNTCSGGTPADNLPNIYRVYNNRPIIRYHQ